MCIYSKIQTVLNLCEMFLQAWQIRFLWSEFEMNFFDTSCIFVCIVICIFYDLQIINQLQANTSTNISWLTNVNKFCVPLNHSFADACISENLYQSLFVCSSSLMKQVFRNCCTKHAQLWFLTGLHHCSFIFLSALSPNCLSKFWCIMLWACTAVLWTTLWAVPGGVCVVRWYDSWWRVRL